MIRNLSNLVRRISTNLDRLPLVVIGMVAIGALFPVDPVLAQASKAQKAPSPSTGTQSSFKDCDVCPEMVTVPAGTFLMGSPKSEEGHTRDERPQHQVTIGKPFAVGKYEVTIAEWNACIADAACAGDRNTNPASSRWPAIAMTWSEAKAYVAWLSRKTGKTYRLMSEAEWEYAARAGTTTPYYTGATLTARQANVAGKKAKPAGGFSVKRKAKRNDRVGRFPPNAFGLYDMHGNVWEWNEDCVNDGYVGAPTDGSAWATGKCHRRIIRGGAWVDYPVGARSAIRSGLGIGDRGRTLGLRVAKTLD